MKRGIALLILFAVMLSFAGCIHRNTTIFVLYYGVDILYDENGAPTHAWIGNYSEPGRGWIYEVSKEGDKYYVSISSSHRSHRKKVEVKEMIDGYYSITLDEEIDSDEYPDLTTYEICLKNPKNGDNAYDGEQVVNLYYIDQEKTMPVLAVTDEIDGEVRTVIIRALEGVNGEKCFVFSDGDGDYTVLYLDKDNPEKILSDLPDRILIGDMAVMTVKFLINDTENRSFSAEVEGLEDGVVEFEARLSIDRSFYLLIPTVDDQYLSIKLGSVPMKPTDGSSGTVAKVYDGIMDYIILPRDFIKY